MRGSASNSPSSNSSFRPCCRGVSIGLQSDILNFLSLSKAYWRCISHISFPSVINSTPRKNLRYPKSCIST
ncbi:hypothetical protein Mapa_002150 [Marchantia paleacea]|nr:hypothetical protein Mapa_002150 [Marchantia paleacea]